MFISIEKNLTSFPETIYLKGGGMEGRMHDWINDWMDQRSRGGGKVLEDE